VLGRSTVITVNVFVLYGQRHRVVGLHHLVVLLFAV
jgi:hypothetical protein